MEHYSSPSLDAVLSQLTDRGRVEWELAVAKATLEQARAALDALAEKLDGASGQGS